MTAPPPDAPLTDEQIAAVLATVEADKGRTLWADSSLRCALCGAIHPLRAADDIPAPTCDRCARTLLPQSLRELKAAREELRALKLTDHDLREMPLTELQQVQANLSAILTERDSLRAQLATVTRERDEARAGAALEAQHHHHLRKERDSLRSQLAASEQARHEAEQLAESRFAWANQVADRTAEQIAAFIERSAPYGVMRCAADVRSGAWRTKEPT